MLIGWKNEKPRMQDVICCQHSHSGSDLPNAARQADLRARERLKASDTDADQGPRYAVRGAAR